MRGWDWISGRGTQGRRGPALAFFLLALLVAGISFIRTPLNGDTYVYARSLTTFEGPGIHLGHYALGAVLHALLRPLGVSPLFTVGLLSILCSGVAAALAWSLAHRLTGERPVAAATALLLLFSGPFWLYSAHGEIYLPQLAFVLLSLTLAWDGRRVAACLGALVAVAITPTSLLALPALLYLVAGGERGRLRRAALFSLPFAAAFLLAAALDFARFQEVLGNAIFSPLDFLDHASPAALAGEIGARLARVYGKSFHLLLLALPGGAISLYRANRRAGVLLLLLLAPFAAYLLNLGLLSGDHLLITFFPLSLVIACGAVRPAAAWLGPRRAAVPLLLLVALHGLLAYQLFVGPERREAREMRIFVQRLHTACEPQGVMIADFHFGMAYWYLAEEEEGDYFILTGQPDQACPEERAGGSGGATGCLGRRFWIRSGKLLPFMARHDFLGWVERRPVYFVDRVDWPTPLVRRLLRAEKLSEREGRASKREAFSKYLGNRYGREVSFQPLVDSRIRKVYRLRAG